MHTLENVIGRRSQLCHRRHGGLVKTVLDGILYSPGQQHCSNGGRIYLDATGVLQWGFQPVAGIIRVEGTLLRHALRSGSDVGIFTIDSSGRGSLLTPDQFSYLKLLLEDDVHQFSDGDNLTLLTRIQRVWVAMRSAPIKSGKASDRHLAGFVIGFHRRHGLAYQFAKTSIRLAKQCRQFSFRRPVKRPDPLRQSDAVCFLSTDGVSRLSKTAMSGPFGCRLTAFLHDLIPLDFPELCGGSHPASFERNLNFLFERAHTLFCVSADTAHRGAALMARRQIETGPDLALSLLGSFLKKHELPVVQPRGLSRGSYAIYCSTIEARKNHIILLRVWKVLAEQLKGSLPTLVFVGRRGSPSRDVEGFLARNPDVAANVQILSNVSDSQLSWLYQNAKFGLFPSLAEGFGLGAAECLDFGLPVFISDVNSLREATADLMPALPPTQFKAWCEVVEKAVTNKDWLQTLRNRIETEYSGTTPELFASAILAKLKAINATEPPPSCP